MLVLGLLLSIGIGVSLGLLGGGGSILTVPTLHYVLGLDAHAAVAGSLLIVGVTCLAALVPHARARRVRWRTGLTFGASSMVGAFAAGQVARVLPGPLLLAGFGVIMIATALAMLRRRRRGPVVSAPAPRRASSVLILAEGLVVGMVTGLVGAGGGFLVVPALVLLGGLPMAEAVATSTLVIALKSFAGFAGYAGDVALPVVLVAAVALTAIGGSLLGSALLHRVRPERLETGFAWFVLAMAVVVLTVEASALL